MFNRMFRRPIVDDPVMASHRGTNVHVIICMIALVLLSSCETYHQRLHRDDLRFAQGRGFNVYSNARCAHIANMFRPDIVRSARVGIPLVAGGSYYRSETYVRVTEPILVTINQIMLQACIQLELGEISAQQYTGIIRDNSARFIALTRGFAGAPTAEDATSAANASLTGVGSDVRVDEAAIQNAVAQLSITGADDNEPSLAALQAMARDIETDSRRIALTASPESAVLLQSLTPRSQSSSIGGAQSSFRTAEHVAATHVIFDVNSARLSAADKRKISNFVSATCCSVSYVVYGFADVRGSDEHNLMLARLRAAHVADMVRSLRSEASVSEVAIGEGEFFGSSFSDNRVVVVLARRADTAAGY